MNTETGKESNLDQSETTVSGRLHEFVSLTACMDIMDSFVKGEQIIKDIYIMKYQYGLREGKVSMKIEFSNGTVLMKPEN